MEKVNVVRFADGTTGEVPESERETFERDAKAEGEAWEPVGLVRFDDGTSGEVPESEREAFERDAAAEGVAWEPVRAVRAGGATLEVPESEREAFMRDYNADPEMRAEREATARKISAGLDNGLSLEDRAGPAAAAALTFGKELVLPFGRDATPGKTRLEAAANVGRAVAASPLTLAEKGMDAVGFATRGLEALAGHEDKSGFREALETAKGALSGWRERNLGEIGDREDWSVTFAGRAANSITEAFLTAGLSRAAQLARGVKDAPAAAEAGGRLAAVWQAMKNPSAQSALYGLSQAEQTAAKGEKAGAAKWRQMLAGGVSGAAETALESVSQVFGLQGQARDALRGPVEREVRRRLANVLGEGTTEGLQELKTGAVEKLSGFDDADWGEIGAGAAQAVALGMISAGAGELGNLAALQGPDAREALRAERERAAGDEIIGRSDGTAAAVDEERMRDEGGGLRDEGTGGAGNEGATDGERTAGEDAAGAGTEPAPGAAEESGGDFEAEDRAAADTALTRADGARVEALETRPGPSGNPIKGARLLMPDGRVLWSADPGETALAEYWLKDRMEFPPAPRGDPGRRAGDPRVNASRRAGYDVVPGKSVLVELGRSKKPYPAVVVEVLDDTHVRVRVSKIQRALKNNRSGYADIDVRQAREYNSAAVKRANDLEMRKAGLNPAERARAAKDAKEFDRLLLEGDEIADQRALEYAASLPGRAAGIARDEEIAKARLRAAAMLETDADLSTPLGRAQALPLLRRMLEDMRAGTDPAGELETPEELWLERFRQEAEAEGAALEREPLVFQGMTIEEQDAELRRAQDARERQARRVEMERRAAAPLTGTAGDMTGTLPGMEGTSDVPLFTEQGRKDEGGGLKEERDWIRFAEEVAAKSWQHYEGSQKRRDAGKPGKNTSDYRREHETLLRIADRYGISRQEADDFINPHIMTTLNGKREFFGSIRSAARERAEQERIRYNMAPGAGTTAGRPRTVAPGPSGVYGQESGGAGAEAQAGGIITPDRRSVDKTDTPDFKKWFDDSKIVDEDGNPLVVYHGTDADFNTFQIQQGGIQAAGTGFYFSGNREGAALYADRPNGRVVSAFLRLLNPASSSDVIRISQRISGQNIASIKSAPLIREALIAEGFDGVKWTSSFGGTTYVAFFPTQIKSATDNAGTFDHANPNIYYNMAAGGRTVAPGPSGVYGQESGGAGAEAQAGRTRQPASGLPVEEGPQERRGVGMDMRDAVQMYRALTGALPRVKERLRAKGALGLFRTGSKDIELLAGIFGLVDAQDEARIREILAEKGVAEGPDMEAAVSRELAALTEKRRREPQKRPLKVMVHELAHLVDYLPDEILRGRGNILGHIAGMKRMMSGAIGPAPGMPGPLTERERAALRREAEREMKAALGEARTVIEEITREVPEFRNVGVTAEDVKALLGETGGRGTPELYQWFAAQDSVTKREIMIRALKGVVDERAARAAGAKREPTGRTVTETVRTERNVPGYTAADGRRRFRELLREETERRRLVQREAVVAEAETLIPWWRGVPEMEDYFRRPEEMYAELFGVFLADPKALEERAPTTFRAFAGWMNARPEAKRAYDEYLRAKDDGTADLRHAERLRENAERQAETDWLELVDSLNRPTFKEKWNQFRMHFDRRMAPYQSALKDINRKQLAAATTEAERKRLHEDYMRGLAMGKRQTRVGNVMKIFLQKFAEGAEKRLYAAGLDMVALHQYLTLRRIAFELDGRAAPLGFEPASAIKELDAWRERLGERAWGELEKAATEFRALNEQYVIADPEVRAMFGAETMDMIERNRDYVTFSHVPIKEQADKFRAELKAKGGDLRLLSEDSLEFMARWIEGRAGSSAGPKIFQLKGSLDPVKNTVVATMQKYESILRAARRNAMKKHVHELAKKSGYGGVLETRWSYDKASGKRMPVEVDNRRWKTVVYMDGGELSAFTANRWLAESLEDSRADDNEILNWGLRVNNAFTAFYTSLNYSFIFFNNMRDLQRAAGNVAGLWRSPVVFAPGGQLVASLSRHAPEAFVRSLPKWVVNDNHIEWYLPAAHEAARLAIKGNWAAAEQNADRLQAEGKTRQAEHARRVISLARTGLEKGFLMSHIEALRESSGAGEWDRILHRAGVRKIEAEQAKSSVAGVAGWLKGKAEAVTDWVQEKGETGEHTTKLATLAFLMDKRADLSMDEKLMIVTEWGGSPDFSERGTATRYFEAATQPFFNASKEGTLGSVRAFADHPGEWAAKKLAYVVAPAMNRWLLYSGAGMALYAAAVPDPDERDKSQFWQFLQWCYRQGQNMPDYFLKSYISHPVPIDTGNPDVTVMLTLPMDQGDQVLSTLTWNLMDQVTGWDAGKADAPLAQSLEAITSGLLPEGVGNAPLLSMLGLAKSFVMGSNYTDPFTGKEVWTQPELDTRWTKPDAAKALLGETWNRMGGAMVKRYRRENPFGGDLPRLNEFLNLPFVQPMIGRVFRLGHSGWAQAVARLEGVEEKVKAPALVQARADFERAVREGGGKGMLNISEDITGRMTEPGGAWYADEFQRLMVRYQRERANNPLLDAWSRSKDPATRKRFENLYRLKVMAEE